MKIYGEYLFRKSVTSEQLLGDVYTIHSHVIEGICQIGIKLQICILFLSLVLIFILQLLV